MKENPPHRSWALEALTLRGAKASQMRAALTAGAIFGFASIVTYALANRTDERLKATARFNEFARVQVLRNGVQEYTVKRNDSYYKLYLCEKSDSKIEMPPPSHQTIESYRKLVANIQFALETDSTKSPLQKPAYSLQPSMLIALPDLNGDNSVGCNAPR